MKNSVRSVLVFFLFLISCNSLLFAWQTLNGNGVAVCTAIGTQQTPLVTTDGQGGEIISWSDQRDPGGTNFDIYAQRLNAKGVPQWTDGGVAICTAGNLQYIAVIASDGQGGTVILWQDSRNGTHVYAQRVNSQGSTLWVDDGIAVCNAITSQYPTDMTSDGTTFTIVWLDGRNTNGYGFDVYAQKIDLNGNSIWTTDGVGVCVEATNAYEEFTPQCASDGQGGAIFSWYGSVTGVNTTWGLYAQHINSDGSTLWTSYPYGVPIRVTDNDGAAPQIVSDGNGGAIILWTDSRTGNSEPYVQRVDSTGSTLLAFNGVSLSTINNLSGYDHVTNPRMISDNQGGALITWQEPRISNNIFTQHLNSNASSLWTYGGVNLCIADWNVTYPAISSDSNGGAIIVWQDYRNYNQSDIFTQRVTSAGSTLWTLNGVAICTDLNQQINPTLCGDGQGGAFFAWQDYRNGTDWDIYAQSIYSTGSVTLPYPIFSQLPNLKLFLSQSLPTAFDLSDYITVTPATTYSIISNFLTLSTLAGSSVGQNEYSSATEGLNIYETANENGFDDANNVVKYSTYKIYKLPKIGLNANSSWDINIASYTHNSTGLAIPPSFGQASSLVISDSNQLSAQWMGNTVVHLTALSVFTSPVTVDVIASVDSPPYGIDQDKERIYIYPNLLSDGTFSTANDTTFWSPLEIPTGKTTRATQQWLSSMADSAGTQANGVWEFTFANSNYGAKLTPPVSNWVSMTNGQWYTIRMRVMSDTPNNNHQSLLFGYNNYVSSGNQTDISANALFGIPTTWTWQETPMLVHGTTTTCYPQFVLKGGGAGNVYIDEVQIINAAPTLVDAQRGSTRLHYPYGNFTAGSDTTGWGSEVYAGSSSFAGISYTNGQLQFDFSGAGSGNSQKGIKWTANNNVQGAGHAYTAPVNVGHQVGVRATVNIISGNFNGLGIIYVGAYGVQTSGQQDIAITPSNLIAAAGVGALPGGVYRAVGNAVNSFYQLQFGLRSDQTGVLSVSAVDLDIDNDDPNYGDSALFP